MGKRVLIIINPRSGTMRANKFLTEIVEIFTMGGYLPTVLTTTKQGDGTLYVKKYFQEIDMVVCIGGDGTFNEVVAGVTECGADIPIGYIPAGSTNDFANSLGLSKDVIKAAKDIVAGQPINLDMGSFNGRKFSYVASFGAFTKASYATPQSIKNALGHLAYILEGINSITSIKPIHMAVEADGQVYEGDYLFGAVSNSTSIAGIVTLKKEFVDMSDGLFELILIKSPRDLLELTEIVHMLTTQNYNSNALTFINARKFNIHADKNTSWTLDGEYQEGCEEIFVENLHNAVKLIMNKGDSNQ